MFCFYSISVLFLTNLFVLQVHIMCQEPEDSRTISYLQGLTNSQFLSGVSSQNLADLWDTSSVQNLNFTLTHLQAFLWVCPYKQALTERIVMYCL